MNTKIKIFIFGLELKYNLIIDIRVVTDFSPKVLYRLNWRFFWILTFWDSGDETLGQQQKLAAGFPGSKAVQQSTASCTHQESVWCWSKQTMVDTATKRKLYFCNSSSLIWLLQSLNKFLHPECVGSWRILFILVLVSGQWEGAVWCANQAHSRVQAPTLEHFESYLSLQLYQGIGSFMCWEMYSKITEKSENSKKNWDLSAIIVVAMTQGI